MIKTDDIPLGLYIHLPWCIRKCPYCDFNSHGIGEAPLPEAAYVDRLLADFKEDYVRAAGRPIHSIFIGGGTPSLFSAAAIARLLTELAKKAPFAAEIEITLEANPGAVEQARFTGFREAGVNRISLGVQSFEDKHLKALGRIHDGDAARAAIDALRTAGFDNFNLDIMHGLPEQSLSEAMSDIETALTFAPPHFSWYQLTLEPGTYFHRFPPNLPDGDKRDDIQQAGQKRLTAAGFAHYEVSAYAQPGHACQHNLGYWRFGDYIGIGAGAHGKLTSADGSITRTQKFRSPKRYLAGGTMMASEQVIAKNDLLFEVMLNRLRLSGPISLAEVSARTGWSRVEIVEKCRDAASKDLLVLREDVIEKTPLGERFLNDLVESFIPN